MLLLRILFEHKMAVGHLVPQHRDDLSFMGNSIQHKLIVVLSAVHSTAVIAASSSIKDRDVGVLEVVGNDDDHLMRPSAVCFAAVDGVDGVI